MKLFAAVFFTTWFSLVCYTLFSQSSRITVSKEPAWITKNQIDYSKTSLDKYATDGYIDMDVESQVSLIDQCEYVRRSKKIISQEGVQNASQVEVSFNPSYQQLSFHSITITRDGKTINKLALSKIKTVHQETELNNFIYNGKLKALLILEDVRQGDVIEYAYSKKGFNPIFKNKYSDNYYLNFPYPYYNVYYKLIVPQYRKMNFKTLNNNLEPVASVSNGQQVYEWSRKEVKPLVIQDNTPDWYDPFEQVLVTEYNTWKEVNDWALTLFPGGKALSAPVQNKIKEIEKTAAGDNEKKVKAVLRFVQDDIRYMGIEMGENSIRPADPSKVFAQRFGDCKEKSYLTCCMLNAMNIEASPVLISTDSKHCINDYLPSPIDFNHVTVRVKLGSGYYYYDPTIAYQRGDIKNLFFPDYQSGLIVAANTNSLLPITCRNISSVHVREYFKVAAMDGPGTLTVTTTFAGDEADRMRRTFSNTSVTELMTNYQKFYSGYYDDITADSLSHRNNDETGEFTTTEYYTLPDFWKGSKANTKKFSFSAFCVNEVLSRVKEKQRKMPISLSFPLKYHEEVTIELPEDWNVTEKEKRNKTLDYAYSYRFYCVNNIVHLDADYENLKDNIAAAAALTYYDDLNLNDDFASFELTSGGDITPQSSSRADNNRLAAILITCILAGGIFWEIKRRR